MSRRRGKKSPSRAGWSGRGRLLRRLEAAGPEGLAPFDFLGHMPEAEGLIRQGRAAWVDRPGGERRLVALTDDNDRG